MKLITSYSNADLDGVACAKAYKELLEKKGEKVETGFYGVVHPEAKFVLEKIGEGFQRAKNFYPGADGVVMVDDSHPDNLPEQLEPEEIVEVIDHRKHYDAEGFPNADVQVEQVGAAATLVAERIRKSEFEIDESSAILLYTGIISNTMNFQSSTTTERDREMAGWLKNKVEIPENITREMFEHKSRIERPLKEVFLGDFKVKSFGGKDIGIAQLEIIDIADFVEEKQEEISTALKEIKQEKELDYIFLTCADLEDGFNLFVTPLEESKKLLENTLDIEFSGDFARGDDFLLRKEIEPKLKQELEP